MGWMVKKAQIVIVKFMSLVPIICTPMSSHFQLVCSSENFPNININNDIINKKHVSTSIHLYPKEGYSEKGTCGHQPL